MFSPVRFARRLKIAAVLTAFSLGLSAWLGAQESGEPIEQQAGNGSRTEAGTAESSAVMLLSVQDAIGPATSSYIQRGIERAEERGAALVVIELDTPGGLDSAMRDIIQAILSSSVPVATYVWPQGARAASAGTYILYASHVAAMAPATNLGAATPVAIGGSPTPAPESDPAPTDSGRGDPSGDDARGGDASGTESPTDETSSDETSRDETADDEEAAPRAVPQPGTASERKAINDAIAYIRSLAERRGRNADWAESAVRSAESLSATAALEQNVIDLIANDLDDLLRQVDGMEVMLPAGEVSLDTQGALVERFEPDWRTKFLAVISNPTVAYMLMLIGIYGLIFEGYSPGAILPGVVGAISLLLALFAFQVLPVNYVGLALILLGIILIIAEFLVPSFGALGFGGIAAFIFGSIILIDTDVPGFGISLPLITGIATAGGLALLGVVWLAMQSRTRPVVSGNEQTLHATATALEDFDSMGDVWIHGERWRAHSDVPIRKGQKLAVTRIEGLLLHVTPTPDEHYEPIDGSLNAH